MFKKVFNKKIELEKRVSSLAHKYPRSLSWQDYLDCLDYYRINMMWTKLYNREIEKWKK